MCSTICKPMRGDGRRAALARRIGRHSMTRAEKQYVLIGFVVICYY